MKRAILSVAASAAALLVAGCQVATQSVPANGILTVSNQTSPPSTVTIVMAPVIAPGTTIGAGSSVDFSVPPGSYSLTANYNTVNYTVTILVAAGVHTTAPFF